MKKQNVGNACGWADRLARLLLLPALTLVLLCSCDEDKAKSERPEEGDQLWKIVPFLHPKAMASRGSVSMGCRSTFSTTCHPTAINTSMPTRSAISNLSWWKRRLIRCALMMDRDVPHVFYEASDEAKKNTTVTVTDMNETIPDMVLGTASVFRNVGATVPRLRPATAGRGLGCPPDRCPE